MLDSTQSLLTTEQSNIIFTLMDIQAVVCPNHKKKKRDKDVNVHGHPRLLTLKSASGGEGGLHDQSARMRPGGG